MCRLTCTWRLMEKYFYKSVNEWNSIALKCIFHWRSNFFSFMIKTQKRRKKIKREVSLRTFSPFSRDRMQSIISLPIFSLQLFIVVTVVDSQMCTHEWKFCAAEQFNFCLRSMQCKQEPFSLSIHENHFGRCVDTLSTHLFHLH